MFAARIFLAIVGVLYLILGAWCAIAPQQTANSVGFTLQKGAGQSEFFVVYGGLELAWGLAFLTPLVWHDATRPFLYFCLLMHGAAVIFRGISLFLYSGVGATTYTLAVLEWVVFLVSAGLFYYVMTRVESV